MAAIAEAEKTDTKSKNEKIGSKPTQAEPVIVEENENLYASCEPLAIADDVIINVPDKPIILPSSSGGGGTKRLMQGERIKGNYYRKLVTEHKVIGLQLCQKLSKSHLQKLEAIRKERLGEEIPKWVKDSQDNKNDNPKIQEEIDRRKNQLKFDKRGRS